MTGRDEARRIMGLPQWQWPEDNRRPHHRGQTSQWQGLPMSPQELQAITGDQWQRLEVPPAAVTDVYHEPTNTWEPMPRLNNPPMWEEGFLFATRHQGWLVLYGARPASQRGVTAEDWPRPFTGWWVGLSHSEMDQASAERAVRHLAQGGLVYAWGMALESELLPYLIYVDTSEAPATRLADRGVIPPQPSSQGLARHGWIARAVAVNKGAAVLLRELQQ